MLEGVAALLFAACNLFAGTDAGVLKVCESVALVPQPTRRSTKKPKVNRRSHFIDWLNTTLRPPLHGFCRKMTNPFLEWAPYAAMSLGRLEIYVA